MSGWMKGTKPSDKKPCGRRKLGAVRLNKPLFNLTNVSGAVNSQRVGGDDIVTQPCTAVAQPQDFLNEHSWLSNEQQCPKHNSENNGKNTGIGLDSFLW